MERSKGERKRLDFTVTVSKTADPNVIELVMTPDPRRYQWLEHEGEQCLFDRFENVLSRNPHAHIYSHGFFCGFLPLEELYR